MPRPNLPAVPLTGEWFGKVNRFINQALSNRPAEMEQVLESNRVNGLPGIDVSPHIGKFLHLQALACRATKVLEIGTLGGYSSIWLAKALPETGKLVTLEYSQHHADVAKANIEKAGLSSKCDVRVGRAQDTLVTIDKNGEGPFDLVFIDADKDGYPEYLEWAIKLGRKGTVIIFDNAVQGGRIALDDDEIKDTHIPYIKRVYEEVGKRPGVEATAIPTANERGIDGLLIAVITGDAKSKV